MTGLYDIGLGDPTLKTEKISQRSWDLYLRWFNYVLSVNSCAVVHVEEATAAFVLQARGCDPNPAKEFLPIYEATSFFAQEPRQPHHTSYRLQAKNCRYPTEVIITEKDVLRATYGFFPQMQAILKHPSSSHVHRPHRVEKKTADYNLLMFMKMEWLLHAAVRNPFQSAYLFWVDGGYGKGMFVVVAGYWVIARLSLNPNSHITRRPIFYWETIHR